MQSRRPVGFALAGFVGYSEPMFGILWTAVLLWLLPTPMQCLRGCGDHRERRARADRAERPFDGREGAERRRGCAVWAGHTFRSSTDRIEWSSALRSTRSARERVGRMCLTRLGPLMESQMPEA